MKDIKDYLQLYLGQNVLHTNKNGSFILKMKSIDWNGATGPYVMCESITIGTPGMWSYRVEDIKLVLRPWTNLKVEEVRDVLTWPNDGCFKKNKKGDILYIEGSPLTYRPEEYRYLCSIGIDLFGLIDAGIAVDSTKVGDADNLTIPLPQLKQPPKPPKPPLRPVSTITDDEMYNVCLLSGETGHEFTFRVERIRDEDENIRYIDAHCVTEHGDGSKSYNVIVLNVKGMVQVIYKDREGCDNICRRDAIVGQVEVLTYLRLKGFDLTEDAESALMMLKGREVWLTWRNQNNKFTFKPNPTGE